MKIRPDRVFYTLIILSLIPIFLVHAADPTVDPNSGTAPASTASDPNANSGMTNPTTDPAADPNASTTATPAGTATPPAKPAVTSTPKPKQVAKPISKTAPVINTPHASTNQNIIKNEEVASQNGHDYPSMLAGGALASLAAALIILRTNRKNGKKDPCGKIKKHLDRAQAKLYAIDKKITLKEEALAELQKKIDDKKEELKTEAILRAKDKAKEMLKIEEENLAGKSISLAENAVGKYDDLSGKYDQAKNIIDALKKARARFLTKKDSLESAYNTCMLGAGTYLANGEKTIESISNDKINVILIHGSPRSPAHWVPMGSKKRWITWIKEELEKKGIDAFTPNMPVPWQPVYQDWKEEFEKLPVHENSILVGHSAGGAFLPRWLGETKQKIKKLILVAPGKNIGDYPNAEHNRELYDFEIDPTIKERVQEIIIFTSPEEPPHRKANIDLYKKLLDAKVISLSDHGHYVYDDMKTYEFPELLNEIV